MQNDSIKVERCKLLKLAQIHVWFEIFWVWTNYINNFFLLNQHLKISRPFALPYWMDYGWKYELKTFTCDRHLSMKPFVLFCHTEISQTMVLHAMLLVFSGKLLMSRGASMRFETIWSYSVEPFFQWNLNKIQTKNCTGIWKRPWCSWKVLGESDLIDLFHNFQS
jgi:hypothetical protein